MLKRLEPLETMDYGRISEYECGKHEPRLMTIVQYVRYALRKVIERAATLETQGRLFDWEDLILTGRNSTSGDAEHG
jgi:hypothetical protein